MTVVVIEAVSTPAACHGVIARYLPRVGVGLYVGSLTARVRDILWDVACGEATRGSLTMIIPDSSPQGFELRGHGHPKSWLSDWDGLVFLRLPLTKDDLRQLNS